MGVKSLRLEQLKFFEDLNHNNKKIALINSNK